MVFSLLLTNSSGCLIIKAAVLINKMETLLLKCKVLLISDVKRRCIERSKNRCHLLSFWQACSGVSLSK
jgi:hypothetical protein